MKRKLKAAVLALSTLLLFATIAPRSQADAWNKKTVVTFNDSVEIPGQVLPAGTYVFKLADSLSNRNIVQVWNADENQILATILTTPAQRLEPQGEPVFQLEERPGDSPMALKYWFYPGDTIGQEFAYSYQRNSYNNYSGR